MTAWDNGQGGFGADLTITNLGDPWDGWTLGFAFPGDHRVEHGWSADWSQAGAQVTAVSLSWNSQVGTGASVQIGFNGTYQAGGPEPDTFTVNGATCAAP